MPIKAVTSEDGVLKLVFLGWFVKLYYEPITAREVMDQNPEHSVTLPDFWKKPWIVIQPESVLKPGRVFYIIPNHVIGDLIKAYRLRNQFCSMKYCSPDLRKSPPLESGAKQTPIYRDPGRFRLKKQLSVDNPDTKMLLSPQFLNRRLKQQSPRVSPKISSGKMNLEQQSSYRYQLQKPDGRSPSGRSPGGRSLAKRIDTGQDCDQILVKELPFEFCGEDVLKHETHDRSIKQFSPESRSWVESWLEVTAKQQQYQQEFKGEALGDSWFEVRPNHSIEHDYDNGDSVENPTKEYQVEFENCSHVHVRKSCLRTQSDNGRKSDVRRVTFVLPVPKEKDESPLTT